MILVNLLNFLIKINVIYYTLILLQQKVKKETFNYPNKENRNQENNQDD